MSSSSEKLCCHVNQQSSKHKLKCRPSLVTCAVSCCAWPQGCQGRKRHIGPLRTVRSQPRTPISYPPEAWTHGPRPCLLPPSNPNNVSPACLTTIRTLLFFRDTAQCRSVATNASGWQMVSVNPWNGSEVGKYTSQLKCCLGASRSVAYSCPWLDGPGQPASQCPFNMIRRDYGVVCTSKEPAPIITSAFQHNPPSITPNLVSPNTLYPCKGGKKRRQQKRRRSTTRRLVSSRLPGAEWMDSSFIPAFHLLY